MVQKKKRETELAWAAGFFDGEGTFHSTGKSISASVGQVNKGNLIRFLKAVGTGTINGPYQLAANRKPMYVFQSYGDDAFTVFRKLSNYLGKEKTGQFLKAAIKYCFRTVANRGGNPKCKRGHSIKKWGRYKDNDCMCCRRLRKAGFPLPSIKPPPTAFDLRLHGIREYEPAPIRA